MEQALMMRAVARWRLSLLGAGAALLLTGAAPPTPPGPVPTLEFAFSETVTLAPAITPGRTSYGGRNLIPITGGTFAGPRIRGRILPGGWDWQLRRADGCIDIKADYMLKTDDGVVINIVNKGTLCQPASGKPVDGRTIPVFEAPLGRYEWLGKAAFIGTLTPDKLPDGTSVVRIGVWQVR